MNILPPVEVLLSCVAGAIAKCLSAMRFLLLVMMQETKRYSKRIASSTVSGGERLYSLVNSGIKSIVVFYIHKHCDCLV